MKVFQYSGIGKRTVNQDRLIVRSLSDDSSLYIVADGMGGYSNGAEAAELVANVISDFVAAQLGNIQPEALLRQALVEANQQLSIRRYSYGCVSMGTVVALVLVSGNTAYCTWLGDSRIYHYRNGQQLFVSIDHSVLMEREDNKVLSPAQIERYSCYVTRCIMGDDKLGSIEITTLHLQQGDTLILCSDGFHKKFNIEQLPSDNDELQRFIQNSNTLFDDNYSIIKLNV
jgi:serine/threonine protein phosphatase PrpC